MRKVLGLLMMLMVAYGGMAQAPAATDVSVKRVVKVGDKWYVEETRTMKLYVELTSEMLFAIENEGNEEAQDEAEKKRADEEAKRKKAERAERNKLLRDALRRGYEPEVRTLEEIERVKKIKERLKI